MALVGNHHLEALASVDLHQLLLHPIDEVIAHHQRAHARVDGLGAAEHDLHLIRLQHLVAMLVLEPLQQLGLPMVPCRRGSDHEQRPLVLVGCRNADRLDRLAKPRLVRDQAAAVFGAGTPEHADLLEGRESLKQHVRKLAAEPIQLVLRKGLLLGGVRRAHGDRLNGHLWHVQRWDLNGVPESVSEVSVVGHENREGVLGERTHARLALVLVAGVQI
mmetsp:Transcript_3762/g.7869  ORF Transcript_3762/g.7869 Transcript_3762/m.7869 type:complete len:218 (-) Transcript_3762:490-1143(-)